jgi:Subtilase family
MWRVNRSNFSGGDSAGPTDVDVVGGFADAGMDAPVAPLQSVAQPIEQTHEAIHASSERGVNASVWASSAITSATSLDTSAPIPRADSSATSLDALAATVHGSTGAAGIGPHGATPAEVRQAVNGTTLATTGAGITVGVMSDSFNYLGGAAADEADGALPPASQVNVLKDLPNPNPTPGTDEGRAMMQIVHDIAPGANLAFYTAALSAQDFADGIIALANAGCSVICDDETAYDEPFYQTDVVANAIQTVQQRGVIYVTCAGNQASAAYQSGWSNIASTTYGGQTLTNTLNFGTATSPNPVQTVKVKSGAFPDPTPLIVEWNQPFGDITSSLAVVVFRDGSYVGTFDNNGSGNPLIRVNLSSGHTYQIAMEVESGPPPSLVKDEIFNDADAAAVIMDGANAGTVYGHHMSPYAITVGAVNSADTPGNGGTLFSEPFSSSGAGTQLWFNYDGSAVSNGPLSLSPVAISGVDDINTTVSDIVRFFGTSAATPGVAAVIANMLQVNAGLPFALIKQILQQTALPFGASDIAGAGLVDALSAVNAAMPNSPPAGTTADMVLNNSAGVYEIYNIGGDSMLAAYQLGQVGPNWVFVTLGGFNGSDTTDMLLRDSSTGGFEVYDISNNQITGAAFIGTRWARLAVLGRRQFFEPRRNRHAHAKLEHGRFRGLRYQQ